MISEYKFTILLLVFILQVFSVKASNEPEKLKIYYSNKEDVDSVLLNGLPVMTFGPDSIFIQSTPSTAVVGFRLDDINSIELAQSVVKVHIPKSNTASGKTQIVNIIVAKPEPEEPVIYDLSNALVTLSSGDYFYTGAAVEPRVKSVVFEGQTLEENEHYSITYENNFHAGVASVIINGMNDYTGSITTPFTIEKARLVIRGDSIKIEYGDAIPELTYSYSGFIGNDSESCLLTKPNASTSADMNSNVGKYPIRISGTTAQDYRTYEYPGVLVITPKDISSASVILEEGCIFTGEVPVVPNCQVTLGDKLLQKDIDYTMQCSNNVSAGTGLLSILGKGNYTGRIDTTFVIKEPVIDGINLSTVIKGVKVYNAQGHLLTCSDTLSLDNVDALLARQPKGMYIIKANNTTYKIIKK